MKRTSTKGLTARATAAALALFAAVGCVAGCAEAPADDSIAASGPTTTSGRGPSAPLDLPGVPSFDVTGSDGVVHLLFAKPLEGDPKAIQLYHVRSEDGGGEWSEPVAVAVAHAPPARAQRGDDPQIAARGDRLMALWTARGDGPFGSGPLACALSDDGGRTWRAGPVAPQAEPLPDSAIPAPTAPAAQAPAAKLPAAAAPPHPGAKPSGHAGMKSGAKGTGPGYRFPATAAGDEAFHVVWIHAIGEERSLRHARLPFRTTQWSQPAVVDPEICACCWNELKAAPNGRLVTLYRDVKPSDMMLATSGDGGQTWESRGRAGPFDWHFEGCPHVGGGLAFAGDATVASVWTGNPNGTGAFCVALDATGTWSAPSPLSSAEGFGRNTDVASLGGMTCAAVWDQSVAEGEQAIFGVFSQDGGKTWTESRRLSPHGTSAAYPRIVGAGDRYIVLWTTYGKEGTALGSTIVTP